MVYRLMFCVLVFLGISTFIHAEIPRTKALVIPPLQSMKGENVMVKDILANGKNIALIFWQTWCPPCLREMPFLVDAFNNHSGKLQFIGVIPGPDDDVNEKKIEKIVKNFGISYPQVRDRELSLTHEFEIEQTPTIVIIGKNYSILYKNNHLPPDWKKYYR